MKGRLRLLAVLLLAGTLSQGFSQTKTWTTTSDFNEGLFLNTNASEVAGEVRMNAFGTAPLPFINIPVGGPQLAVRGWNISPGRVVRINTNTGKTEGEYRLVPEAFASAPSRAVVDSQGNVWVMNRYDSTGIHSTTKIGVLVGGTRYFRPMPGVYIPFPLGEYVKDAIYTTGVDRDGDGYIRTSAGPGNLLPWVGTAGKDLDKSVPPNANGVVEEAADELITVFKRLSNGGNNTRAIAIDEFDNIWVGNDANGFEVWKIDGNDGHKLLSWPIAGSYIYTMFYESGYLWVSGYDFVRKLNVSNGTTVVVSGANNSLLATVTPMNSQKLITVAAAGAGTHSPAEWIVIDKATASIVQRTTVPGSSDMRGVAVDQSGNVWVSSRALWASGAYRVYKYSPTGTLINEFYTGDRPCGMGMDSNGYIWVTHIGDPANNSSGSWTTIIDPNANGGMGAIAGYVGLGTGSYNYSDGTGATTSQIARSGEWRVTFDSFRPNLIWGTLAWTAVIPAQTSLEFFARAANTRLGLNGETFQRVFNSGDDTNGSVIGRYVELRVRFARADGTAQNLTPALRSLTIKYSKGTVSGTVGLGNWLPEQYPTANFILRPTGGGSDTYVHGVELGPFGAFAFKTHLRGTYYLLAKSSHWLQQQFPVPLNITDDGAHGNVFALLNGDVDGDNEETLVDYGQLATAFGSVEGDANWIPGADLDGDGEVNLGDLAILAANFGLAGDE